MGIQAPAEVKYGLIHEAVRQDGNLLNISALCRIAGVSRSGYYAWVDAAPLRQSREETDSVDFALVKQAYEFRGYKKGARSIYMRLLHLDPPVVMNIKKIRRLMKKYGLFCPIRQENPYRQMAKAMKTSHVAKNEINRQFRSYVPRKALLTDIDFENFRVRFLTAINSLNFFLSACMLFLAPLRETSDRNMHFRICVEAAAPLRPKVYFFYYRLAEGLHFLLSKAHSGIRGYFKPLRPNQRQMKTRGFT